MTDAWARARRAGAEQPIAINWVEGVQMSAATMAPTATVSPTFGQKFQLVDHPGASLNRSADGKAATLIFDGMALTSETGRLVTTRVLTVTLPLEGNGYGPVHVVQDVRGFAALGGTARLRLIVHGLGVTSVVDPTASPVSGGTGNGSGGPGASPDGAAGAGIDYMARVECDVPAGAVYRVTLILITERDSGQDAASESQITIDSLDLSIATPAGK